ncbi:IS3 family transposase, partial [Escherichia coli]|nr:IS3 family transposase [Escherichia coli]
MSHITKAISTSKKIVNNIHLKLAERIGVTAAARELSLYESQ